MAVLPDVLGCRLLRRTTQVRLATNTLRLSGDTTIFAVSRQQFMNYPGQGPAKNLIALLMAYVSRFSIAFRLPYGIFVNLFVFTPAPCEREDFLFDASIASYLLTQDIAGMGGLMFYLLFEIRQSLSQGLERKLYENCH